MAEPILKVVNLKKHYPIVHNDETMTALLRAAGVTVVGEENMHVNARGLGGEDFSFFEREVPGVFFHTGCKWQDRENAPAHNGKFCPNPEGFFTGGRVMITTALKYLAQN